MTELMRRRRALMAVKKGGSRLPAEYQEVEWIQVSGSTYQELPVKPSLAMRIELDVAHIGGSGNIMICRRSASGSLPIWRVLRHTAIQNNYITFRIVYNGSEYSSGINTSNRVLIIVDAPNNQFMVDSVSVSAPITDYSAPDQKPILGSNSITGGSPTIKIWNAKQYVNDSIVANCVPCYKKLDNTIGLYDIVSDSFIAANGTTVTKGADV